MAGFREGGVEEGLAEEVLGGASRRMIQPLCGRAFQVLVPNLGHDVQTS